MVFSPQKGANREQTLEMDRWMEQFAGVVRESYPEADAFAEGAGAAGGNVDTVPFQGEQHRLAAHRNQRFPIQRDKYLRV